MTTQSTPNTAIEAELEITDILREFKLETDGQNCWYDELVNAKAAIRVLINTQAEERANARVKAFAEELKKYNGAYIGIGGRRVDNMVHHQVIDEVLTKYTKGGAQ